MEEVKRRPSKAELVDQVERAAIFDSICNANAARIAARTFELRNQGSPCSMVDAARDLGFEVFPYTKELAAQPGVGTVLGGPEPRALIDLYNN